MKVRQPIPAENFDHGDARRYRRGCNCRPCVGAATAEARRWKYLRDTGRGGNVPASSVIAHIWKLRAAGMTDLEIRAAAKLSPPHLYQIIRNGGDVRHSTAARILSIPTPVNPEGPSRNGAGVPSLGTIRRLRTLNAEGWPCKELDRRLGISAGYTAYMLRQLSDTVRLSTADSIRHLYRELLTRTPEGHGIAPTVAKQTRARAAANDWARAAYWDDDDFDNPDYTPAAEERELKRDELAAFRRDEIEHLEQFNLSEHEIANRLGMAYTSVRNIVLEIRSGQRRVRPREGAAANPRTQVAA